MTIPDWGRTIEPDSGRQARQLGAQFAKKLIQHRVKLISGIEKT